MADDEEQLRFGQVEGDDGEADAGQIGSRLGGVIDGVIDIIVLLIVLFLLYKVAEALLPLL